MANATPDPDRRNHIFSLRKSIAMERATERRGNPNTAYVFPGQGSQFVGMGLEFYQTSRAAKDVFDQVDDILSMPLTDMIFNGPEEDLKKTAYSQPAIMATSLACYKALEELDGRAMRPAAVAGHSLGEYSSLVVAGVLDLEDGVRLVQERAKLMQEAAELHPGSMAAIIGLDEETVEEICAETGAEMANVNGNDQIVISGDKLCVARAVDMCSIRGARKAIALAVNGAFHSSLMSPAQEGLASAIDNARFRDPAVPVIANATSRPITSAAQAQAELKTQLCNCVRWKQSVSRMIDGGVSSFIEFGPGRVLGGLIKRISANPSYRDSHVEVMNVADPSTAQKVAEYGLNGALAARPLPLS
jgi:[acyl-carrier-protein] S-malonyltransferase